MLACAQSNAGVGDTGPKWITVTYYLRCDRDHDQHWSGISGLISFLTGEGLANLRLQTELALAHEIQTVLVPPISYKGAEFEAYGRSIPSEKVGGDLVDIVEAGGLLAYVADVSGHGLPAGQLMGMLKTAVRVAFQLRRSPAGVLDAKLAEPIRPCEPKYKCPPAVPVTDASA